MKIRNWSSGFFPKNRMGCKPRPYWFLTQAAYQTYRFRWAFCQLECLRRNFPASIRSALNELPKGLDGTYERILLNIDEEKQEYAQRLFHCLTLSIRPLRVDELAEILAIR